MGAGASVAPCAKPETIVWATSTLFFCLLAQQFYKTTLPKDMVERVWNTPLGKHPTTRLRHQPKHTRTIFCEHVSDALVLRANKKDVYVGRPDIARAKHLQKKGIYKTKILEDVYSEHARRQIIIGYGVNGEKVPLKVLEFNGGIMLYYEGFGYIATIDIPHYHLQPLLSDLLYGSLFRHVSLTIVDGMVVLQYTIEKDGLVHNCAAVFIESGCRFVSGYYGYTRIDVSLCHRHVDIIFDDHLVRVSIHMFHDRQWGQDVQQTTRTNYPALGRHSHQLGVVITLNKS